MSTWNSSTGCSWRWPGSLALLLLVTTPVVVLAQNAPVIIRGTVSAADTRAALPRARLTIEVGREPGSRVYTNDRGEFAFDAPSAPAFTVSVVKAGYAVREMVLQRDAFARAPARELAIALTRSAAVNGRVVDAIGETIVGQRVYADRLDADASTASDVVTFATTTDDRGEYRLGGLPPGRYSVTATDAQDPGAVVTLELRPGDDVSDIGFTSRRPPESGLTATPQPAETAERATIRGRVISTSTGPIARAAVQITGPIPPRYVLTDAQGRFAFPGLIPGNYEVRASKGDFLPGSLGRQTAFESTRLIAVIAGARVDDITLLLSRGFGVTGTIVDRAGEPLQGVLLQAFQVSASGDQRRAALAGALVGGSRRTDDRGRYRLLGLHPGTYVIAALADAASLGGGAAVSQSVPIYFPGSASIADAVTVTITTADVEGIDFAVGDVPAGRVTGVAFDSTGAPLAGTITLALSHRSGNIVADPRTTRIEADGAFAFFNVAPGDYVVQAVRFPAPGESPPNPRFSPLEALEFAAQYVTVGSHDTEPISLRAARGAVVDARIVIDSPVPDDPYGQMRIEAVPVGFDFAPISVLSSGSFTRVVDGRFRIGALTGPRRFVLDGTPDGWYLKSMTINGSDVTDQVVNFGVGAAGTMSAEVVISSKGGTIVGRIATEQRTVLPGASVIVFPQDREKWFERSRFIKDVRPSRDGAFRASSLPPGEYYVAAAGTLESADATAEALERLVMRAETVTLNDGEERRVELSR